MLILLSAESCVDSVIVLKLRLCELALPALLTRGDWRSF